MNKVQWMQANIHYLLWMTNSQWRKLHASERRISDETLDYFTLIVDEALK